MVRLIIYNILTGNKHTLSGKIFATFWGDCVCVWGVLYDWIGTRAGTGFYELDFISMGTIMVANTSGHNTAFMLLLQKKDQIPLFSSNRTWFRHSSAPLCPHSITVYCVLGSGWVKTFCWPGRRPRPRGSHSPKMAARVKVLYTAVMSWLSVHFVLTWCHSPCVT